MVMENIWLTQKKNSAQAMRVGEDVFLVYEAVQKKKENKLGGNVTSSVKSYNKIWQN